MELKGIEAATVRISTSGNICIEQYSHSIGSPVEIYLTPQQFNNIETFVFKNRTDIELLWNEGVENDSNS